MQKLTVIVPTFNEEANLDACLDSVRWADEILVVDSFSTDRTLEIAQSYGARIIQRTYGYSASQKNWAIPQAKHSWILLVDSDERVPPTLAEAIQELLCGEPQANAYWIYRANHVLGRRVRRCGWGTDKVIRLFRRDHGRYEDTQVHAEIQIEPPVGSLRGRLVHHSFRSFSQYAPKLWKYARWGAEDEWLSGKRASALDLLLRPAARFVKMYVLRGGFLEGTRGLVVSYLGLSAVFLKYARLWEKGWEASNAPEASHAPGASTQTARG
ncbi:MAG: glycosyltransferase family 2 protein [Acidobacteriota bacterium]|nr:glycosyltransferase family 2 protein [Acidobacteriota bacterium]